MDVLEKHGWRIVEAPPADDCPDGVFVEDVAVIHRGVAVLTRPGAAGRRGEVESMAATLADLGLDPSPHRARPPRSTAAT